MRTLVDLIDEDSERGRKYIVRPAKRAGMGCLIVFGIGAAIFWAITLLGLTVGFATGQFNGQ